MNMIVAEALRKMTGCEIYTTQGHSLWVLWCWLVQLNGYPLGLEFDRHICLVMSKLGISEPKYLSSHVKPIFKEYHQERTIHCSQISSVQDVQAHCSCRVEKRRPVRNSGETVFEYDGKQNNLMIMLEKSGLQRWLAREQTLSQFSPRMPHVGWRCDGISRLT